MPTPKYTMTILPSAKKVPGRLMGFVDTETANALVNTPGAARKIFTSESIKLGKGAELRDISKKRFVFATDGLLDNYGRAIFISPKIYHIINLKRGGRNGVEFICTKDLRYEFFPKEESDESSDTQPKT